MSWSGARLGERGLHHAAKIVTDRYIVCQEFHDIIAWSAKNPATLFGPAFPSDPLRAGLAFSQIQGHCATQWLVVVSGTVLTWWL